VTEQAWPEKRVADHSGVESSPTQNLERAGRESSAVAFAAVEDLDTIFEALSDEIERSYRRFYGA
jgi:hypothetical protein